MSAVTDQTVTPLVLQLLDCLTVEVAKVPDPPKLVQLRTGGPVSGQISTTDDECCEGLAWVRQLTAFPSSEQFPQPDQLPLNCTVGQWAVMFELGVLRCAPTPPPERLTSADEWKQTTLAVLDDEAALRRTICCFLDLPVNESRLSLTGAWLPIDVDGGCVGGTQQVTLAVMDCDC